MSAPVNPLAPLQLPCESVDRRSVFNVTASHVVGQIIRKDRTTATLYLVNGSHLVLYAPNEVQFPVVSMGDLLVGMDQVMTEASSRIWHANVSEVGHG